MKNIHLEHPEDSILTGDLTVLDWFVTQGNLSVKIDGAPAIVWGTNPATGRFFVGTKSVFNKVKIKINHSHEEIDQNHQGEVASILHACFDMYYTGKFNSVDVLKYIALTMDEEISKASPTEVEAIPLTIRLYSNTLCSLNNSIVFNKPE